jgi:3-hydroxyacyl-CoA dehydrogenase
MGPFEAWDALGVKETAARMKTNGVDVPAWVTEMLESGAESFYAQDEAGEPTYYCAQSKGYKRIALDKKELSLAYLKQTGRSNRVAHNSSASLLDIGDGVACLQFHSLLQPKLNPIDDDIIKMMETAVEKVESDFDGLVIHHDGDNFCAGANLLLLLMNAKQGNWKDIDQMVSRLQNAIQGMRYSSKPVVVAPSGLALGGGAEIVLAGNAVQAAGELYIGLVEVGVGLIPGGAGNLNLLKNWYGRFASDRDIDPTQFLVKVFMSIGMGKVAESAEEGREMGFLRATDGVTLNRSHLLNAAKERALGMARAGFRAPRPTEFRLPGRAGAATIDMMLYSMQLNNQISAHDRLVGGTLARVLTGGDTSTNTLVTEQHLLDLEREAFLSLCGEEKSQARMEYMLKNNKPLRN